MVEKCDKCNKKMGLRLLEKGELYTTEIWRCLDLRCGYMKRVLTAEKKDCMEGKR